MATKNATARSQKTFTNQFNQTIQLDKSSLFNHSKSQGGSDISKTASWYQSRIQQLEQEKHKLSQHIDECYDYIEHQSDMARRMKAKLRQMHKKSEGILDSREWVSIPRSLVHRAIIMGLILYAFGLVLSL